MDIGARLKEARVAKGLSLDELQDETKIQKRYLVAIEEGRMDILPGKFYARAFIKEYANAVGLNVEELLEEHQSEIPKTEDTNVEQYSRMERSRKASQVDRTSNIFSVLPSVIVVLLVIGIIAVAWFFIKEAMSGEGEDPITNKNDNEIIISNPNDVSETDELPDETDEEEITETEEENVESGETELSLVQAGAGANSESIYELRNPSEQVTLLLESSGNTWLEIYNGDNEQLYFGAFSEEQSPLEIDVTGEETIYFGSIGFAPDLKITIDGVELEYALDPNENHIQQIRINVVHEEE